MPAVTFHAVVDQEQVIRAPSGVSLPCGEVEVVVRPVSTPAARANGDDPLASTRAWMLELAASIETSGCRLPQDLAEHHDHYAHGKPRP
jgi:hypothetical protein